MCLIDHTFPTKVLEDFEEITFTSIPGNKYQCQQDESLIVKEKELTKAREIFAEQKEAHSTTSNEPVVATEVASNVTSGLWPGMDFLGAKNNSTVNPGKYNLLGAPRRPHPLSNLYF